MPGPLNAQDAVLRTRRYCAILDDGTYRDGFSTDADTSASLIPILPFENIAIRILCDTGIVQQDYTISAPSGQHIYPYPSGMGKSIETGFTISGENGIRIKPLREVTLTDLRARDRFYRYTGGEPAVYATIGPDFIIYPVPMGNNATMGPIVLRGTRLPADLTVPASVPSDLPIWFHEAYPLLGAIILLSTDDNPSRQNRIGPLTQLFIQLYPGLEELVTARSVIRWKARAEGDSLQRMMEAPNGS